MKRLISIIPILIILILPSILGAGTISNLSIIARKGAVTGGASGSIGITTHTATLQLYDSSYAGITDSATRQAIDAGTISYAHVWIEDSQGGSICISLKLASDGSNLLTCQSSAISDNTAAEVVIACTGTYDIVAATDYRTVITGSIDNIVIGKAGSSQTDYDTTYTCGGTINGLGAVAFGSPMSIYLNNSATGVF